MGASERSGDVSLPDKFELTVILTTNGECWVAQGIQIDYVAYGKSMDDAKVNFEKGLSRTIEECAKHPGAVSKFIKPVPDTLFKEYLTSKSEFISHPHVETKGDFLIDFLSKKAA